jgi:hypothetical protein
MPSLAVISAKPTPQFPRIIAWARSVFCSFVDVDERPYLSASTTPVRLILNISIHSHTLQCVKQFCTYLAASCRLMSAPLIPPDTKESTVACCLSLVQTSSGAVIFTPHSLGINGLQLNHTRSMSPSHLELQHDHFLSSVANHTTKIFERCHYFLYLLRIDNGSLCLSSRVSFTRN